MLFLVCTMLEHLCDGCWSNSKARLGQIPQRKESYSSGWLLPLDPWKAGHVLLTQSKLHEDASPAPVVTPFTSGPHCTSASRGLKIQHFWIMSLIGNIKIKVRNSTINQKMVAQNPRSFHHYETKVIFIPSASILALGLNNERGFPLSNCPEL